MNKESLKEYLSSRYQGWNSFLSNVIFPIFGENDFEDGFETELLESQPERRQLAEATGIRSIKQVGMMYVGVEPLQIFDVTVSDRVMMERNRVNIQRLIRAVMDQFSCAFMLFHYEDDTRWDWRFTYCRKSGNKEETTDSKRYTFLLGPGQSCRTATDNFMALYDKRDSLEIKDIEDAFNVEALSKEFFGKYKAQYEAFVNYMVDPANGMRQDFIDTDFDHTGMKADKIRDREEKPIRDYVKKLLGRIVFLHFLQKKGWLGVPAGKEWGEGDRDFMLNIFKNATERQKENFLDDILEDLFEEGLDRNRSDRGDLYDTKVEGFRNCRIPYLNGGLFERDNLDKKPSHFPASYFDGLLTMLSQYNFTIDENDPNDAEVGVDPEMLGRIFENLLEDNKDNNVTDSYKFSIPDVNLQPTKLLFQIGFLAGLNQTLYDAGSTQKLHTLANYPIWTINRGRMENGEMTETTWEYNALSKPMVVHINKSDYLRPQVSVGYTLTPIRLYTARFKSLNYYVPKYYGKLIDNILKRPKILQTQILLDSFDIQSLDLFNPIWLEEHGFWFYVSKINNFQAGEITKVDLIRM